MPYDPRGGDFADSPDASQPADLSSLDGPLERAAELIADAIRADRALPFPRAEFERHAVRVLAAPVAAAVNSAGEPEDHSRAEFVNRLIGEVRAFRDPYLALRCLPIVFNIPGNGESEQQLADEFGLGRATVSKVCVDLSDRMNVPPGRGMRSPEARRRYSDRQKGKRARPHALPWAFAGMFASIKKALA
jgi:hypothetical protein